MKDKVLIGITDCSKYLNYERWMLAVPGVETVRLGYVDNNADDIKKCDGVILTGGEDVAPHFYNKPEELPYCDPDNMDEKRDEFELKLLAYTEKHAVPLLGICRGLQITNVFFGGSLISDIPTAGKPDHSKFHEGKDRYHEIRINPFSMLQKITGSMTGQVNSAHHQAADKIGKGLIASAFSEDGVVEALERNDAAKKSFLMLVQWHPERMDDQAHALTMNIRSGFLESVFMKKA